MNWRVIKTVAAALVAIACATQIFISDAWLPWSLLTLMFSYHFVVALIVAVSHVRVQHQKDETVNWADAPKLVLIQGGQEDMSPRRTLH